MLVVHKDSHLDHGLTEAHLQMLRDRFADREGFFIETFEIPAGLAALQCALHGPVMGDPDVPETECSYTLRNTGGRMRRCRREPRDTRLMTVIAGPHDGQSCVLYTAFGGPQAPRAPGDEDLKDEAQIAESNEFWSRHALSV
jgi:hypothetical protein